MGWRVLEGEEGFASAGSEESFCFRRVFHESEREIFESFESRFLPKLLVDFKPSPTASPSCPPCPCVEACACVSFGGEVFAGCCCEVERERRPNELLRTDCSCGWLVGG